MVGLYFFGGYLNVEVFSVQSRNHEFIIFCADWQVWNSMDNWAEVLECNNLHTERQPCFVLKMVVVGTLHPQYFNV